MKLRDRLLLFSTAQLAVFGTLFALAFASFEQTVLPMLKSMLQAKAESLTRSVSTGIDVPLWVEDRALLERTLASVIADPDFAAVIVRDPRGQVIHSRGEPGDECAHDQDAPGAGGHVCSWTEIHFEGLKLGAVSVVLSTARYDAVSRWAIWIGVGGLLVWLMALAYSIVFARSFVSPIRAMMVFSRQVAGGAFAERLEVSAPGELGRLRDHLNEMTAELARREAERQTAAAHAEKLQRELLSVSRLAGMAEIATGVLHNVGNVLNSLNVSVAVIDEHVRGSRIAGLTRSLERVDSFPGGLPAFLGTEQGKVLPTYLATVTRHLAEENAKVLDELGAVGRHVDHIKAIVAMQQSYAQPAGVMEPVAVGALIDDALRMAESSFVRHGVEVIKDYDRDTTIMTDRHKILQIMINLVSNARHALKEHPAPPQRLTVEVRLTQPGLTIRVIDTGIGIPAENLEKIFSHGFTTKPAGHGFGLHTSANTARELGGNLQAASDGPGRGAVFTLTLPAVRGGGDHALPN